MIYELDDLKEASEQLNEVFELIVRAKDQRISHEQTAFKLKNKGLDFYKHHEKRERVYSSMIPRLKKFYNYKQSEFNKMLDQAV